MTDKMSLHKIRLLLLMVMISSISTTPGVAKAAELEKKIKKYQIIKVFEDNSGNFVAYLNKPVTKPDSKTCDYLRVNPFKCPIITERAPTYKLPQPSVKPNQPPSTQNLGEVHTLLKKIPKSDGETYLRAILWMSEIMLNVTLTLSKTERDTAEAYAVIFSMVKDQIDQHKMLACSSINSQLKTTLTNAFFHQISIEDPMVDNDCALNEFALSRSITK